MGTVTRPKPGTLSCLAVLTVVAMLCACAPSPPAAPAVQNVEIARQIAEGSAPYLLDVRSVEEFEEGHLPGAVNIPYDELEKRLAELSVDKDDEIVVYCRSGRRAIIAENILVSAGYSNVKDLAGHMNSWSTAGLATEK